MKILGFNSPYALVGMFFAVVALGFSRLYDFRIASAHGAPLAVYVPGSR